jgi:hypothetical protein
VHRFHDQQVEITIREVTVEQGATWLLSLSTHEALPMPTTAPTLRRERPGVHVEGIVAWAWIPQPGTAVPTS